MSDLLDVQDFKQFVRDGFIRVDNAFSPEIAADAVDILWDDLPCDRSDPTTWSTPVIRLGMYSRQPFIDSINSDRLYDLFDRLVGIEKWIPCRNVGTFPVRFPSDDPPNDTGKHVDASFPGDEPGNYLAWRINVKSKGRGLLMLILYSDVGQFDAPTIIYKGSHLDVAKLLSSKGDRGLSFMELASALDDFPQREKEYATGKAGTIYLCHPFLVHSAQAHRGKNPKFMAQPPLIIKGEFCIEDCKSSYSPVVEAIRLGAELE